MSKAVAKVVDWKKILERTPPNLRSQIGAFKSKSDKILTDNLKAKSATMTIDWDHYKKAVDNTDLVESFKCQYEELVIPHPIDTKSEELAAKTESDAAEYVKFVKKFEAKEGKLNDEVERLCSLPPFEQMTWADIYHHFPRLDHSTKNWGYTDMTGNDRREFIMNGKEGSQSNPPDQEAYIRDMRDSLSKTKAE